MHSHDLTAAISLLQGVEIKYSNIGVLSNKLVQQGFTPETAKMAVMLLYGQNPDVQELSRTAGANAYQAAKALYSCGLKLEEMVDILAKTFDPQTALDAAKSVDLEQDEPDVNSFTDINDQGTGFNDHNVAEDYSDIPVPALEGLSDFLDHHPNSSPQDAAEFLSEFGIGRGAIQRLVGEIYGTKTSKISKEVGWDQIVAPLLQKGLPPEKIQQAIIQAGGDETEAQAAIGAASTEKNLEQAVPLSPGDVAQQGPSQEGYDPNSMGPEGDGGGLPDIPTDIEDGQYFGPDDTGTNQNPGPVGQTTAQEPDASLPGAGDIAQGLVSSDPQMTSDELFQQLTNQGINQEEARAVAEQYGNQDEAIEPGRVVQTPDGRVGHVTGVWETLFGKMASVALENQRLNEYLVEDLKLSSEEIKVEEQESLLDKVSSFLEDKWYDSLSVLPQAYKTKYASRVDEAGKLVKAINGELSTKGKRMDYKVAEALVESRQLLQNEITFCKSAMVSAFTQEEEDYLNAQKKYEFLASVESGYSFGPGGAEGLLIAAEEAEQHMATVNWNQEVISGAVDFASGIHPRLIGDATQVAKMARSHIESKAAFLPSETKENVVNTFVANVETARRRMVVEYRQASIPGEVRQDDVLANIPEHLLEEGWLM